VAQLKDDCFAHGDALTPLDKALNELTENLASVVDVETTPLMEALGRILAEDIDAPRNVPPHDNSAVDGYVVFFEDLQTEGETRLPVTGRIAAGHPLQKTASRGEALRIFTGAQMPEGPDTVFMQEDVRLEDDHVILPAGIKRGANRRFMGEDIKAGSTILTAGKRLRPQEIGLAASVGYDRVKVYSRLKTAVFSTGDEVRDPSDEAPEGCIFDSNRFNVMGLLRRLGADVTDLGILPDDEDTIRDSLSRAAEDHDILITSGGVSLGEEDHVKAAVESLGSLHFWRLAIKPGRPIALGQVGKTAFVGLPGNPVAAMVTFMRIARPLILVLSGARDAEPVLFKVPAGFSSSKKPGRREWLRASLKTDDDGVTRVYQYPAGGSGVLTSMVASDGLIELPEDVTRINEGEPVDFLPFSEVCP